ncbi:hypothetical protein BP5796_13173 [Coleophoma crateriformis]|uniref:Heterokaryon incompatibility domain-containing protein n=1 Tax=Coleophoma crateriformis TaxID=565419 RepID=A0A3D8Q4U6_9HELO|nr:hypothetical protein BP5796_13173 [Coleophoma crateriformis]
MRRCLIRHEDFDGPRIAIFKSSSITTDSESSWNQATEWYTSCLQNHPTCREDKAPTPYLPTRVIDISSVADDIKLAVPGTGGIEISGSYATLSHCWGTVRPLQLLQSNIDDFKNGIPMEYLPKTFIQAIEIVRRLQIPFIWIDSLCIIQDSLEDWQKESALMDQVYSRGTMNIMATDSRDSTGGLFWDRKPSQVGHIMVATSWDRMKPETLHTMDDDYWNSELGIAPLNRRDWVLQERNLAPRSLHFGRFQLYWECREVAASEAYPDGVPSLMEYGTRDPKIVTPVAYLSRFDRKHNTQTLEQAGYNLWYRLVERYSRTSLTKPSDRLVAISGIARRLSVTLGDTYIAGLWTKDLPSGLLWESREFIFDPDPIKSYRPDVNRAPTWSWASIKGLLSYSNSSTGGHVRNLIQIEEINITPVTGHDIYGQLANGYIQLKGTLMKARIERTDMTMIDNTWLELAMKGERNSASICLDVLGLPQRQMSVVFLPVVQDDDSSSKIQDYIHGLLLKASDNHPQGWYERLGTVSIKVHSPLWSVVIEEIKNPSQKHKKLSCGEQLGKVVSI